MEQTACNFVSTKDQIYFLDKFWPDFNQEDLNQIIENYSQRTRNFGTR